MELETIQWMHILSMQIANSHGKQSKYLEWAKKARGSNFFLRDVSVLNNWQALPFGKLESV